MLNDLLELVHDAGSLHSRLVLIVGGSASQRTALLSTASASLGVPVVPLGIDFARRAAALSTRQRSLQATSCLRATVDAAFAPTAPALLDRVEVLFDASLKLDALDALKRLSHARTVLAAWPGELRNGRLTYAPANHPEHCDHPVSGCLVHQLH
jgi:hypothetical protein